jgi:hypothetical protein
MIRITGSLLLAAILVSQANATETSIDPYGRLKRIGVDEGWLDVQTDLRIPSLGWKDYASLGSAAKPGTALTNGDGSWQPAITSASGLSYDVEQTVHAAHDKITFDVKVTSRVQADIEGVFFWIDIPEDQFAGGAFMAGRRVGELPVGTPDTAELAQVFTSRFMFVDSASKMWVSMTLNRPTWVLIKDQRQYGENFSAFVQLYPGTLDKGDSTALQITIEPAGVTDDVAHSTLKANDVRFPFQGFGGNYAFAIETPVTQYTLEHLKVALARTAMTLTDWEPDNPNPVGGAGATGGNRETFATPPLHGEENKPDWKVLVARDQPETRLRREFELMRELTRRKIPYVASIWSLPPWMYEHLPKKADADGNEIATAMWPQVLDCISTYLQYAKEKYQAEPDFLSFNEPDIGIHIKFTADQHGNAIKRLAERFTALGIKTRLLLGDVANPRYAAEKFARTAAAGSDKQDGLKVIDAVGAVAFHSWGGAAPAEYAAWSELAQKLKLPLFVTEAGVDPFAWHDGRFQNFDYGLRELMQYQHLLQYARPQAILFWEFSEDYSLLSREKITGRMQLTPRFCYQKQFADLTPPGSEAVTISSERQTLALTAFRHPAHNDDPRGYTVHIANQLWGRKLVIDGIPSGIEKLNAVHTTRDELFKELTPIPVHDGKIEIDLPAQSLTTLTTLAIPVLEKP